MSGYLVAVDYGTVNTVAVLRGPDGQVRPLLVDGSPLLPCAAAVGPDGRLLLGRDADNAGRVDPAGFVPDPRSRIEAGAVVFGGSAFPVVDVIGGTLARVAQEAIHAAGGVLPRLVLTHPGSWGQTRRATLTEAGFRAGLGVPTLLATPVAAAWHHVESVGDLPAGRCLLVYHLGVGTFEASLVRRTSQGCELVAVDGLDDVGGADLDDLLNKLIGAAVPSGAAETWRRLVTPTTTAELRRFTQWCDDVRAAKEALSRQLEVDVHVPLLDQQVRIPRAAFESAAEPLLARTVDVTADLLAATGTPPDQVGTVLLLGGSTRMPLVDTLLHRRLGLRATACTQPEFAVAEGALTATAGTVSAAPGASRPWPLAGGPPIPSPMPPTAPSPATGSRLRRRPTHLLAMAAGLAFVLGLAGMWATRQPPDRVPDGGPAPVDTPSTATGRGIGVLASAPATTSARIAMTPRQTPPTMAPSATSTPGPATSQPATAPVTVFLTAAPTSGSCDTDITFVAHFTVNQTEKYRWHWAFGGPNNYSSTSGDHDRDKTGDVRITKKFNAAGSGTYWAQIQITSPVTVTSNQATVRITCTR